MSNSEKQEILEMLANKEISKEEAEKKLAELGDPISAAESAAPPAKSRNGCLIAIIILAVLLPIILVLLALFGLFFFTVQRDVSHEEALQREMYGDERIIIKAEDRDYKEINNK